MMDIQIVDDQHNFLGIGIDDVNQVTQDLSTVQLGAPLADPHFALSHQRFYRQEKSVGAVPLILIIFSQWLSGFHG